ncbi:MAG: DUF6447 family protein [Synechococcaceae cyanobacterium]
MEPQQPDAGTAAGSEPSALSLLALLAPAAVVDSLTGFTLPLAPATAGDAADTPPPEATSASAAAAPARAGSEVNAVAAATAAAPGQVAAGATPSALAPRPVVDAGAPVSLSPRQLPASLDETPTLLTIAGRRYGVADLPPDARELFEGIRLADRLLAQKGETCQQLRWGLEALVRELGQRLQTVEPLPELVGTADPRSPAGDGAS